MKPKPGLRAFYAIKPGNGSARTWLMLVMQQQFTHTGRNGEAVTLDIMLCGTATLHDPGSPLAFITCNRFVFLGVLHK